MSGKSGKLDAGMLAELVRTKDKSSRACPGVSTAVMRWWPTGARAAVARTEEDSGEELRQRPGVG
jgi:hypothetical protein